MTNPPRVLLVDDESHIVHMLSVKLRSVGFRVACARDGRAGLGLALDETPDLMITDYQMPYLNGVELSRALQEHADTRDTPVIMLSARSHGIQDKDALSSNIKVVMGKPFNPREVLK